MQEIVSALVVIPSIGSKKITTAIDSVLNQTSHSLFKTDLLIVTDGPQYAPSVESFIPKNNKSIYRLELPWNTGNSVHGNFYGHRIYGAVSYIFDHSYILYLDEDNWFDNNHVETLVRLCIDKQLLWSHSLRKIYSESGQYICDDDCESLGRYSTYLDSSSHLVDTSAYCIHRSVAVNSSPAWYGTWGTDRQYYNILSTHFNKFECTGLPTLNYRLDGNQNSVTSEFFIKGNEVMNSRYNNVLPWKNTNN